MKSNARGVCSGLILTFTNDVIRYARSFKTVFLSTIQSYKAAETPGTLKVEHQYSDHFFKKKISFSKPVQGPTSIEAMEIFKKGRLVAVYTDETGRKRVCGSIQYPLSLEYFEEGGVIHATLTGADESPDGFVESAI